MDKKQDKQVAWGRMRFGNNPRMSALAVALPVGLIVAVALSALAASVLPRYEAWWQSVSIYLIMLLPVSVAGVWAMVVDRTSLPGAVRNPEASVEQAWAKSAAFNALLIMTILISIALTAAVLAGYQVVANTLLIVLLGQALAFAVAYQVEAHRR